MNTAFPRRPHGFSIIELMVAATIGLILTMLIGQIFINSRQIFSSTDNLSRLQENARYTLTTLTRAIRLASHKTDPRIPRNDVIASGASGAGSTDDMGAFRTLDTLRGWEAGTSGSPASGLPDSFTVRFQGSGDGLGTATSADGTVQDCAGRKVDAVTSSYAFPDLRNPIDAPDAKIVVNTYLIQADPNNNNEPTLFCNTVTPTSYPASLTTQVSQTCTPSATCLALIPGVESMQILYGEDQVGPLGAPSSLSPDGSIDRWVPADSVANWNNVLSVRISILMRTDDRVANVPTAASTAYTLNGTATYPTAVGVPLSTGGVATVSPDTRLRRTFTTVIDFRNRTQ